MSILWYYCLKREIIYLLYACPDGRITHWAQNEEDHTDAGTARSHQQTQVYRWRSLCKATFLSVCMNVFLFFLSSILSKLRYEDAIKWFIVLKMYCNVQHNTNNINLFSSKKSPQFPVLIPNYQFTSTQSKLHLTCFQS